MLVLGSGVAKAMLENSSMGTLRWAVGMFIHTLFAEGVWPKVQIYCLGPMMFGVHQHGA
jgi:uncharacterized membrane protein